MSVHEMRQILKRRTKYSGSTKWERRVDSMPDKQVMAVYYRLLGRGEILNVKPQEDGEQVCMSVFSKFS